MVEEVVEIALQQLRNRLDMVQQLLQMAVQEVLVHMKVE
jgi:hypothetical protein